MQLSVRSIDEGTRSGKTFWSIEKSRPMPGVLALRLLNGLWTLLYDLCSEKNLGNYMTRMCGTDKRVL